MVFTFNHQRTLRDFVDSEKSKAHNDMPVPSYSNRFSNIPQFQGPKACVSPQPIDDLLTALVPKLVFSAAKVSFAPGDYTVD
jgi:hypothetical protein